MTTPDSRLASSFKQARLYRVNPGRPIRVIVIHDMEAPEGPTTAENCQNFFAGPDAGGSAHYCIDTDSIAQSVREADQAAHAPGTNTDGIGLELCGYARQTRAEWLDATSIATMQLAAALTVDIARRHYIPLVWLTDAELAAGKRGICSHAQVSRVYKRSDHTDPGPNFPIDVFMAYVNEVAGNSPNNVHDSRSKDRSMYEFTNGATAPAIVRIDDSNRLVLSWRYPKGQRSAWLELSPGLVAKNLGEPLVKDGHVWVPVIGATTFGDIPFVVIQPEPGANWSLVTKDALTDYLVGA